MIKCKDGIYYDEWSPNDEIDLPVLPMDYHIVVKQLTEAQREIATLKVLLAGKQSVSGTTNA